MEKDLKQKLTYLQLYWLVENLEEYLKNIKNKKISYYKNIMQIIQNEYELKKEKARKNRIVKAKIPEKFVIETYPFNRQPILKKKLIMNIYDSLSFVKEYHNLIFLGPTGCGKTGLSTSFLIHAINNEYRGLFVDFSTFLRFLKKSLGDHTEQKIIKKYVSCNILLIDEVGYDVCSKEQAAMFFEIIRNRHKKSSTIITSQLGFSEWNKFMPENHITAALLDRLTEDCTVFNMSKCKSLRIKKITNAIKEVKQKDI